MPTWDFKCPRCNAVIEITFGSWAEMKAEADAGRIDCQGDCWAEDVHVQLERQPAAGRFRIEGFNARNGYSK